MELKKELDDIIEKIMASTKTTDKKDKDVFHEKNIKTNQLSDKIKGYEAMLKTININEVFIPNKLLHIKKWSENLVDKKNMPFTSEIMESDVIKIMSLDIHNNLKILLLLGIGVMTLHDNSDYLEIIKSLVDEQKMYLIIASSDFIYGTNYQCCHGYISKDITVNITQEKIFQAMGRIGRGNYQNEYTIRLRDDQIIPKIFMNEEYKLESVNMNKLLA